MARSNEADGHRRRVPEAMALDVPTRSGYRGKIIKKTIERNRISTIKRKYFKELKKDTTNNGHASEPQQKPRPARAAEDAGSDSGEAQGSGAEHTAETSTRKPNDKRKQRSNPFQKVMREREDIKKKRDEERRRRELEIREAEMRRKKSAHRRKNERNLHNARTSRGQPALSSQITSLLTKIKKSD
ncbi:hypothetical protein GGF43_005363 [Coemansia sp. RSA 2618]|nr:hypothetical protein GGF43_005363 [Coemansia sp. RSA 2618]